VSFGDGKNGFILGIGKIGRSTEHFIDNVHYVNGLKYNFLSVSQIYDKGNEVKFLSDRCIVTKCVTNKVLMSAKRVNIMYVADLDSIEGDSLTCVSAQIENENICIDDWACELILAEQACCMGPGPWTTGAEVF